MRIFKSKWFARFARKECITDARLCEAVRNAERGSIDADYGDGGIKQRIARPNEGKSGGYRTIILFRMGELSFFVYGFPKSAQANIDDSDERDFKKLAETLLASSDEDLKLLVERNEFLEVMCNE
jgi:hypothetical protein